MSAVSLCCLSGHADWTTSDTINVRAADGDELGMGGGQEVILGTNPPFKMEIKDQ